MKRLLIGFLIAGSSSSFANVSDLEPGLYDLVSADSKCGTHSSSELKTITILKQDDLSIPAYGIGEMRLGKEIVKDEIINQNTEWEQRNKITHILTDSENSVTAVVKDIFNSTLESNLRYIGKEISFAAKYFTGNLGDYGMQQQAQRFLSTERKVHIEQFKNGLIEVTYTFEREDDYKTSNTCSFQKH